MRAVSNTSPISNLAIIGRLSLLRQRYGQVLVPLEVARELGALSHPAGREAIKAAFDEGWLAVEAVPSGNLPEELRKSLDSGEAEAIALAVTLAADVLLMDERKGRVAARAHHLKVAGVLGELLHAKFSGEFRAAERHSSSSNE